MPFPNGAKAQDEPATTIGCAGLVWMSDDARVEQGRRLKGVFVEKIGAHQLPLKLW